MASDGAENDWFGHSVAIDKDTTVIGAHGHALKTGIRSGSAYVYTRNGTVWTEQTKLTASDGAGKDYFGFSVAIDGDAIVVGAYSDDTEKGTDIGSVYIYTRLFGTVWTEQTKLVADGGLVCDRFGSSVAINGDTIVIGANSVDPEEGEHGSAYVFAHSGNFSTRLELYVCLINFAAYMILL